MNIIINFSDEYNDYFTLTDDQGQEYQWHCRKGAEQDPEKILLLIRKLEYPVAKYEIQEGETELQAIERWIAEGHTNQPEAKDGEPVVIEKIPWISTHPTPTRVIDGKKISGETLIELSNATTIEALRAALQKILIGSE